MYQSPCHPGLVISDKVANAVTQILLSFLLWKNSYLNPFGIFAWMEAR